MKEIILKHFFNYEFVYVFLFCSVFFLLISIFIKKTILKKISILLFSIIFMFCVFELMLSFFMPFPEYKAFIKYMNNIDDTVYIVRELHFFDKNRKKTKYRIEEEFYDIENYKNCVFIFNQEYSFLGNGFRATKCNDKSESVFLFLGCSFMFGDGVDDYSTLPYNFSKTYNFEKNIINCGVSAKSSNTALNIVNNGMFLPLINNKNSKINHFFYNLMSDHIYRNFRYEGVCLDGYLYKNNKWYIPTAIGKVKYVFARSYIFRKVFLPMIDEYFEQYYEDYMIKSLEEMNKIVEEKYKSKLTIIVWDQCLYSKYFMEKLKGTNLDLIVLPEKFNLDDTGYRIKDDGHPTAKANEELARILYNHINNKNRIN